jgi:hypothetical protein
MVQELNFNAGVPYKTSMVITAYKGRIQSIVAQVRMECPQLLMIRDARVVKGWRTGKGPKVDRRGQFAFRAGGAYFHGVLSRSSAIGGATANYKDDCRGVGRFNAQRKHF